MSGISLTASMRSNLLSLQGTNKLMDLTQQRLSTGKKVNSAIDNPSSFYTAQSLTNRAKDLGALLDSMGQAVSTIKAATEAMESGLTFLEQAGSIANQALSETTVVQKQANVKLVDNSAELLATGEYVEVTNANKDQLATLLKSGTKVVLGEDIDLTGDIINLMGATGTITLEGAGHRLIVGAIRYAGDNATLNINNIELEISSNNIIHTIFGMNTLNLSNSQLIANLETVGEFYGISIVNGSINNVSIEIASNAQGGGSKAISCLGQVDLKNISINLHSDLDTVPVTGISLSSSSTANIDGVSMNLSGGNEQIGISNTNGGTIIGALADNPDANGKISADAVNNTFAELSDDSFRQQYNSVVTQYDALISDGSYKGVNLLKNDSLSVSFNESRNSVLNITGKEMSSATLGLAEAKWKNHSDVNKSVSELSNAIDAVRTFITELGNNYSIVQTRENFTEGLINILTEGADKLTLADMNEESSNILSLQTRQQLAVNALSLASQASQSVLKLF